MRHLVWIKRKDRSNEKAEALLILLFIILIPFFLKTWFINKAPQKNLCNANKFVQVEGNIRYPGVYPFCVNINLADLINRGGGLIQGEYPSSISDNVPLAQGVKINIRWDGAGWEIFQDGISAFYKITLGIPISLNRESKEGLTAIPGIGPKLAEEIVAERVKIGGFEYLGEIKGVKGIGEKIYEKIIPYVSL